MGLHTTIQHKTHAINVTLGCTPPHLLDVQNATPQYVLLGQTKQSVLIQLTPNATHAIIHLKEISTGPYQEISVLYAINQYVHQDKRLTLVLIQTTTPTAQIAPTDLMAQNSHGRIIAPLPATMDSTTARPTTNVYCAFNPHAHQVRYQGHALIRSTTHNVPPALTDLPRDHSSGPMSATLPAQMVQSTAMVGATHAT
jgi:hypothetical protein